MTTTERRARTTPTTTLLDVRNLSVDYLAANGTVHAVSDVSFTLRRGEVLGLAGESGCGKSTLAYAVARLLRPPAVITGGEAIYYPRFRELDEGESYGVPTEPIDILRMSSNELRAFRWTELSIVFQSAMNALNPVMDIGTQIMDVLRAHRPNMGPDSRKQRAIELLRLVGIAPDRLRSYPHELSGGMRQRAIIAIALALSPEIIIMDEPTTALDVVVQREILSEIMRLREELGFSVIFITHDLSLLLELADSIIIMYAGRIVEKGTQRDLYLHPRHPYSYGLIHSFPTLHGPRRKMTGIPGSPPDLRDVPAGCSFNPRCPMAFDACRSIFPILQPAVADEPQQQVACHLYNQAITSVQPPTTADIAASYEALAERKEVQ
jgi:peptide/nickel transport system ATP-binding protein